MTSTEVSAADRTVTGSVGSVDDLAVGQMKMAKVGSHRVLVARTESGVHAIDNACPHQGYGLVTGTLVDDLVTCQWHNWKYCVADGTCVVGEEDVPSHSVHIRDGEIWVDVVEPTTEELFEQLWPSLRRGIEADYRGQIARDAARLLDNGADPADIIWEGLRIGCPKADYGVGHELAAAADCLQSVKLFEGLDRTLPVVQALSGISEVTRDRPAFEPPAPDASHDLLTAIENEQHNEAVAALRAALRDGVDPGVVKAALIEAASAHHLNYGHGAIYTQKACELLDHVGWDRADDLLPHLLTAIVYGTREDTLPYMRKAMQAIDAVDLAALAAQPDRRETGWAGEPALRLELLDATDAPIAEAVAAVHAGAGIAGLLDTVSLAVSERLLRYDMSVEHRRDVEFGWLDITHGLTYARAARWAWSEHPGEATARLALFTVFLCFDTGRLERRFGVTPSSPQGDPSGDLRSAVLDGRVDDAVAIASTGHPDDTHRSLIELALADPAGAFIVWAHLVKMAQAAWEEAIETGSTLPLAATARVAAGPRQERFVARNVAEAIAFVQTGQPPWRG